MIYPLIKRSLVRLVFGTCMAAVLTGCGDSDRKEETKTREDRDRQRVAKVAAFTGRVQQLEATLDLIDRDIDIQKSRVRTARADLDAIKSGLKSYAKNPFPVPEITTETMAALRDRHERKNQRDDEGNEVDEERKGAEDSTISTLLLLAFIAFFVVWFGKMWKNRQPTTEDGDADVTWKPAAEPAVEPPPATVEQPERTSYTYPSSAPSDVAPSTETPEEPRKSGDDSGPPAAD